MDWRDLIAWQRLRTTSVPIPGNAGTPVLLCAQNPHRVYLSISQGDGDDPHTIWPGLAPPAFGARGLPIGGASEWPAGPDTITDVTLDTVYSPAGDTSAATGTIIPRQTIRIASVPATHEFYLDKHGVLTQSAWWFVDNGCVADVFVIEVIQDESPCDRKPKAVNRGRFVRGLWLPVGCRPDGGGGDDLDTDRVGERPEMGTDSQPHVSEPLLAILRRASGR